MHFPVTISVAGTPVLLHGICEFLGIFLAFRYYLWLKKKTGDFIAPAHRITIVIAATFGAVLGARLLGTAENIPAWMHASSQWNYFYGNKTLVGGLLGGLAGVELVKRMMGERRSSGDLFVFPLLLGMIVGRIGCFSAGVYEEVYGYPSSLPWAIDLGDGIPRHPATLYEIVFLLLLWIFLFQLDKKKTLAEGALFKLFLISYLIFRLLLDFIKPHVVYVGPFGAIQLACMGGLLYYFRYFVRPRLLFNPKRFPHYAG